MAEYRLPPYRIEALFDAGTLAESIDWSLAAYGIPDLWKQTRGAGETVAVLDTGCDLDHEDLKGQIDAAEDFSGSKYGPQDMQGHGTHVAGTIAAIAGNQVGVAGVAPKARLLVGKVLDDSGRGSSRNIAKGIDWAVKHGASIISMSLGGPQSDPFTEGAIREANRAGVFVICAAGNDGRPDSVNWPARHPGAIAVSAVDRNGRLASFSSRGEEVDIAAPGQDITSCYPGNRYAKLSGTSMATPYVSGVVALTLSKHRQQGGQTPLATVDDLRQHLAKTATDAGPTGKDPNYGWGLINPASMLQPIAEGPGVPTLPHLDVTLNVPGGEPRVVRLYVAEL